MKQNLQAGFSTSYAIAVYVSCICDPVISVRVLRLLHNNLVDYSSYVYYCDTVQLVITKLLLQVGSCTVSLSLLAGCSSNSSKDSTYSLRSSVSLPSEPVNHAVQHLRELQALTSHTKTPVLFRATTFKTFRKIFIFIRNTHILSLQITAVENRKCKVKAANLASIH